MDCFAKYCIHPDLDPYWYENFTNAEDAEAVVSALASRLMAKPVEIDPDYRTPGHVIVYLAVIDTDKGPEKPGQY